MSLGTPINVAEKEISMRQTPLGTGSKSGYSRLGTPIIVEEKEMRMKQIPLSQLGSRSSGQESIKNL